MIHPRIFRPLTAACAAAAVVALTATIGMAPAAHVPAADTMNFLAGSKVEGIVKTVDGDPAEDVPIKLHPFERQQMRGAGNRGLSMDADAPSPETAGMAVRMMATKTDADGKYEFKNVKEGVYSWTAGIKKHPSMGFASGIVKVEDGKARTLNVNLKLPKR
jgi:hypothetical protein